MKAVLLSWLVLTITLTSVGLGHARGILPGTDSIVICQGHISTVIWVDAQGNEVKKPSLCADAALALFADPGLSGPQLESPELLATPFRSKLDPMLHSALAALAPLARGPPVSA